MAGYDIKAGLDIDPKYICSFSHNFKKSHSITESIVDLDPSEFFDRVGISSQEIGILAGGPPCQGFSKNVPRKYRYLDDPKNTLVNRFLDYAIYLSPPIILMENVAEMKNGFNGHYTEEVIERLSLAGYNVTHNVLNAADYGIPQRRRRAFFLANNFGLNLEMPKASHFKIKTDNPLQNNENKHVSVWEAIGDLPTLEHGEGDEVTAYSENAHSNYQKAMRNASGYVKNHIARQLKPLQFERISSLKAGQGLRDLPQHLQTKGGYSGAYGRLTKDMIAPTITRWVFHPGSGRWGHPVDLRIITIREAARIQGFPDSFEFVGSYNDQAGQIGNAVPPPLIKRIIQEVENQIFESNKARLPNEIFSSSSGKENVMV